MTEKSHAERGCDYCYTEQDVDWVNPWMNVRICKGEKCHQRHNDALEEYMEQLKAEEEYARDMGSPWY